MCLDYSSGDGSGLEARHKDRRSKGTWRGRGPLSWSVVEVSHLLIHQNREGKKFLATLKIELKSHPNSLIGYSQDTKAGPSREKSMPTPPSILPVLWASLINLMLKVILKFLPNKLQLCFFLACSGILFWCKAKNPHSSRDLFRELLQQAIWRESCLQPVPHYCWQVEGAEFGAQRMIEKKEEKDKRRQQERLKLE